MESLNLQDWTRIGATNLRKARRTPEERAADVSSAEPSVFCRQDAGRTLRFMESFLFLSDLLTAHESELRKPLEINKTIFRFMRRLPLLTLAVDFSISMPCKFLVRGTLFSCCP